MYRFDSDKHDTFGVPIQVLTLSNMSHSKRKDLIHCLRRELEQIQMLQKKVELLRTNGLTVSSSSDILSCSNGQCLPFVKDIQKLPMMASESGKKIRDSSGKVKTAKHASEANTSNIFLMKECESLLKRLMRHQFGWVFNEPVDVVKLNIPDYFNVIKHPMDLGTIKKKIDSGGYASPWEFYDDARLTFSNAMTYNPPGNDVHVMADTLNKFFEVRWKNIEKKLPSVGTQLIQSKAPAEDIETSKTTLPAKKRKTTSVTQQVIPEPVKRMTDEEKHKLGVELESLLTEMPMHIIDFLREHSSNGRESEEEEIEIDIDDLSDDTLFTLRKLLDDHLQEKQNSKSKAEPCEIQPVKKSGLCSSPMQQGRGDDQTNEVVDARGNEPPLSSYPPKEVEKETGLRNIKSVSSGSSRDSDSGSSADTEAVAAKASSPVLEAVDSGTQLDEKTNQYVCFDQLEQTSQAKSSSVESDCHQDGESAQIERQVSPEKLCRATILKNRFAETILKAREKTLTAQGEIVDPEQLRREREELERQRKKEEARLLAEAKATEDAQRQAEAEAAAEARRKRELERDAARQALLKMEKTVEINENSKFLKDLEMLRAVPAEHLPSSVDETSLEHSQDGLGSFMLGSDYPLEQLGLYMKKDEEEEEGEPPTVPKPRNDPEEGEID
ncbi:bromodomain and extraterminal domain protein 9, Global Transcription Factor Group E 9 [Hibiscus trionum]|uniref:Bromodomain and extraterminal domain protein 9, Global Transcription Factor Group E 9 n=1 Tax=Hibiscus trionum TaxID=183268 RepID=A0A9W7GZH5_HIBTR|nr:bromodomain and extraterminal domain protein 9, Global Transcription Factor Group E 9 [Hibiscus trionum]